MSPGNCAAPATVECRLRIAEQLPIIVFLAAGSLGIGSYLLLLTFGVYRIKKFFPLRTIKKITAYFGISLFLLAAYFLFKSVELL